MRPRTLLEVVGRLGPYRRSHHPHCGPFRQDVLVLAGQRWCIACWVGYPSILAGLGMCWLTSSVVGLPWWGWMLVGLIVASPQGLSFAGRVPSPTAQVAVKVSLGLGLGGFIWGVAHTQLQPWLRVVALVLGLVALQSLWVLRFHRLERTCQACPQLSLRPRCEGLRDLDDRVGSLLRPPALVWVAVADSLASPDGPSGPTGASGTGLDLR